MAAQANSHRLLPQATCSVSKTRKWSFARRFSQQLAILHQGLLMSSWAWGKAPCPRPTQTPPTPCMRLATCSIPLPGSRFCISEESLGSQWQDPRKLDQAHSFQRFTGTHSQNVPGKLASGTAGSWHDQESVSPGLSSLPSLVD